MSQFQNLENSHPRVLAFAAEHPENKVEYEWEPYSESVDLLIR